MSLNENGMISGGIEFDIFDNEITNTITEAPFLKEKIFYFQKNKYALKNNLDLENYAAGLKQFMVDTKDAEIVITGFREREENQSLDLLRAKFIEDVFLNHGINQKRILINVDRKGNNANTQKEDQDVKKVEIKVL